MDRITTVGAILSMNSGLFVEVFPTLRAASISWDDEMIYPCFYHDGAISEEDEDSALCVGTEVIAGFPDYGIEERIIRCDYPEPIPVQGELVYLRREASLCVPRTSIEKYVSMIQQTETLRIKGNFAGIYALLGEVSPALRACRLNWSDNTIALYFYYDGEISAEDYATAHRVGHKIAVCFPGWRLENRIIRWDYSQWLPQDEVNAALYQRKEK